MAASHLRSISMPLQTHTAELELKADLQALRANVCASPVPAAGSIRSSLCDLGEIYRRTDELLCLPGNQVALSHPTRRSLVERELDASLCLIDLIAALRDQLGSAKEAVLELEMALRRKGDNAKFGLHCSSTAEKKAINSCLKAMKRIESSSQHRGSSVVIVDSDLQMLAEARAVALSLLRSIFSSSYRMKQQINSAIGRKWSALVAKALNQRKVASAAWTECNAEDIESGLECLYRRLIQNRVTLLNLLSL